MHNVLFHSEDKRPAHFHSLPDARASTSSLYCANIQGSDDHSYHTPQHSWENEVSRDWRRIHMCLYPDKHSNAMSAHVRNFVKLLHNRKGAGRGECGRT